MNKRLVQTIKIALLVVLITAAVVVYPEFFIPQEAIALTSVEVRSPEISHFHVQLWDFLMIN